MASKEKLVFVDKNGKRLDGRAIDEVRPIKIEVGVVDRADGSCKVTWGHNQCIASVYGPKEVLPKHMANPYKAIVRFYYRMAPFSVSDYKRPAPSRREAELSKVCGEAIQNAILGEKFPNAQVEVHVEFLDMDAGSRTVALTAASVALADAGIPMRDLVAAVAVGRADGKWILDLTYDEETAEDAVDMPIAMMPSTGEVVLLQQDAAPPFMSPKEVPEALKLAKKGIEHVYKLQQEALKKKYEVKDNG